MSTAEYPDALTRRIELLAAASVDEPEGEGTAVAALLGMLRAEIGAVRAELGSLRSETGAVRSDLDGLSGRLTASVAAGRTETGTLVRRVAELSTRLDGVGGRVDDVRNGLPTLSRELREGLSDVPARTGVRLDALTAELTEAVAGRVDTVAADVRRLLNAALEREARTSAGAAAALDDARGALEGRLAVLEEALDLVSERLEAFARDGARTTTQKLTSLEDAVGVLSTTVEDSGRQAELLEARLRDGTDARVSALETDLLARLPDVLQSRDDALRRDLLGAVEAARAEAADDREAVRDLAASVRSALDGFSAVLDRSLVGLGRSVSVALADGRQEDRTRLDDLSGALLEAMAAVQTDVDERDVAATALTIAVQSALEAKVEGLRSQLGTAMTALRSDVATEVATLTPRVDELVVAGTSTSEALRALRSDVVTTTESLRDRLVAAGTDSTEVLRAAMTETRSEVAEITRALREDLLDRIEEKHSGVTARLSELALEVAGSSSSARDVHERVAALAQLSDQSRRAVEQIRSEVVAATDALAADLATGSDRHREVVAAGTTELTAAVDRRLVALDEALTRRFGDLESTVTRRSDELAGSTTARADELAAALTSRVDELRGSVTTRVDELRDGVTGQVGELAQSLTERLVEVGGQVDESTTRTRVSSEAVAELVQRQAGLDATVLEQQAAVAVRLGVLDATVTRMVDTSDRAATAISGLDLTTTQFERTLAGFRDEWPTRTYEVVQGAKAVAEGVVREVREQVAVQLDQVRAELERVSGGVADAREDLATGTDRLAGAGDVLVRYLEERDRLLEAERDRVLHDVLDTFASGLSARDRAALAGRVGDAVARRRDARDAERYRTAVGEPVAPTGEVPADVRRVAERVPARPEAPSPSAPAPRAAEAATTASEDGAQEPAPGPADPAPATPAPATDGAQRPARAVSTAKVPLPKVAGNRPSPGGSVVARPSAARPAGPPVTPSTAGPAGRDADPAAPAQAVVKAPAKGVTRQAGKQVVKAPAATPRDTVRPAGPVPAQGTAGAQGTGTAGAPGPATGTGTADPVQTPAAGTPRAGFSSERRARVDAMPEVRSPGMAIEAAAPAPPPSPPASSVEQASSQSWTSGRAPEPGEDEDGDGARRLFRRRKP